jgi:hypothetical protein
MDNNSAVLLILLAGAVVVFIIYRLVKQQQQQRWKSEVDAAANCLVELVKVGKPVRFNCDQAPDIALKRGEDLRCVFPGTTLLEPRAVRNWRSNYGGPSFRIARGVSFRLGASAGTSESHDELRPLDTGTLALTNQRLIFVGSKRTTSVSLEKIIDLDTEGYSNWLRLNRQGKQKAECFQFDADLRMNFEYNGKNISAPLASRLVKLAINQAMIFRNHPEIIGVAVPQD